MWSEERRQIPLGQSQGSQAGRWRLATNDRGNSWRGNLGESINKKIIKVERKFWKITPRAYKDFCGLSQIIFMVLVF